MRFVIIASCLAFVAFGLTVGVTALRGETAEQLEEKFSSAFDDSRYTEAAGIARRLLKRVQQDTPNDRAALANSHFLLGRALFALGRCAEAEVRFKESLRVGGDAFEPIDTAEVKKQLGGLYIDMGRYGECTELLGEAARIYKQLADEKVDVTEGESELNYMTAMLRMAMGQFADAERNAFEYRRTARLLEGWDELAETHIDQLLGNLYLMQSRTDEAAPFVEHCYKVRRRELRSGHATLLEAIHLLAYLNLSREQFVEAERYYLTAIEGYMRVWGDHDYNTISARHDLGSLYQLIGRNYEAEQMYRKCLSSSKVFYGEDHPELSWIYNGLGEVLLENGAFDEVAKLAEKANEVGREGYTTPQQRSRTKALLAAVEWQRGNHDEAIKLMKGALDLAEKQRSQIGGAELGRAKHFTEYASIFDRLIRWADELKDADLAFATIERSRARTLLDQLQLSGSDLLAGVDPEVAEPLREAERVAANEVTRIERHLRDIAADTTLSDEDREQQKGAALAELQTARQAYLDAYTKVRDASPMYKLATSESLKPMSIDVLKQWCNQHQSLLLEYHLGKQDGYVLIAGPGVEPQLVKLEVGEKQAAALGIDAGPLTEAGLAAALMKGGDAGVLPKLRSAKNADEVKQIAPALAALWQTIVPEAQRKEILEGKYKRLHVIPSGSLTLLPLETLVTEFDNDRITYLLDVGPPIVYGPSATVLANLAGRGAGAQNSGKAVLSVGDPAYPKQSAAAAAQEADRARATQGDRYSTRGGVLSRLPFTDWEVRWVGDMLGKGGWIVANLLRENSTEANFRRLAPGKGMIHIACHGLVDQSHGNLFGALALTPANSDSAVDDGFLTLAEINNLNLNGCNLAILSACETNIGPQQKGEGVWALSRGFLVAGAKRVVASNWLVDDEAGASLISVFCSALAKQTTDKQATDYADALQKARRYVRKQEKWQSPYYWAGFVLLGPE
jgi:CHAT domain-containing protein/tetratricopeptide (TPR) repeat protein